MACDKSTSTLLITPLSSLRLHALHNMSLSRQTLHIFMSIKSELADSDYIVNQVKILDMLLLGSHIVHKEIIQERTKFFLYSKNQRFLLVSCLFTCRTISH